MQKDNISGNMRNITIMGHGNREGTGTGTGDGDWVETGGQGPLNIRVIIESIRIVKIIWV